MRHNDFCVSFANLLRDVFHDVKIKPHLQPLQGETFARKPTTTDDDARLDIKANGLWESRFNKTYFDVKVFNPQAKTCPESSSDAYKYLESFKKNKYEQRITGFEIAIFCPLFIACTSGAGRSASKARKHPASKFSAQKEDSYADIISYLRTKISIALLRSFILCNRGSRTHRWREIVDTSMGAVVEEGKRLV